MLATGLKKYECDICKIGPIWNTLPLVLELDHINGNKRDNRLINLRFLCPNCHSQTPTFRGRKNRGKPREHKTEIEIIEDVKQSTNMGQVLTELKMVNTNNNWPRIGKVMTKYGLSFT